MYSTKIIETEIKVNDTVYDIDLELTAQIVDDSFSHEFGTEHRSSVEVVEAEVQTVYNSEGEVVTSREVITQIENRVDIENYTSEEFDFED